MGSSRKRKRRSGDLQRKKNKTVTPTGSTDVTVSDLIHQANSVLYDSESILNEEEPLFESTKLPSSDSDYSAEDTSVEMATGGEMSTSQSQSQSLLEPKSKQTEPTNGDIMACLKSIEGRLSNMDKRLGALEELKSKVDGFDKELKKLWVFVDEKSKKTDEQVTRVEEKVERCDFSLALANDKVLSLEKEKATLKENIVYLQSQSMRNNLTFSNIPEPQTESNEEVEERLRLFMVEKMNLAQDLVDGMVFERVHRMGQKKVGTIRSIVAKFNRFKDKELVRKQWKSLEETPYYVSEQFPKEVVEKRKKLKPKLRDAKSEGKRAWIAYDTLYIDGKAIKD